MSLMKTEIHVHFKAYKRAQLNGRGLTVEQHQTVLVPDLNFCIRSSDHIHFLAKIGATDGLHHRPMANSMTRMTQVEFRAMKVAGGRSVEGNCFVGDDGDAQTHRQPQGSAYAGTQAFQLTGTGTDPETPECTHYRFGVHLPGTGNSDDP